MRRFVHEAKIKLTLNMSEKATEVNFIYNDQLQDET